MPKAVCNPLSFLISSGRSPSYLNSKYRVGKILGDSLFLEPYEALFLYFTGRITPENPRYENTRAMLDTYISDGEDFDLFRTYLYLKSKGMLVRKDGITLQIGRKSDRAPSASLRVKSENSGITFQELVETAPILYLTLDDEGDVTLFRTGKADPIGENSYIWPAQDELFEVKGRHYLEDSGNRTWIGSEFADKRLLTDMETKHIIGIDSESNLASTETAYRIYDDLVRRNLTVKTGFKYGANFRAYRKSLSDHAEFLIHVMEHSDQWYKISRAVRLSHGVRKSMLFAGIYNDQVQYISISRTLDYFQSS